MNYGWSEECGEGDSECCDEVGVVVPVRIEGSEHFEEDRLRTSDFSRSWIGK